MKKIKIEKQIISFHKIEKDFPNEIIHHSSPKRPEYLPCEIHRSKMKGEEWLFLVGIYNNKPYELFGGLSETIEIPKKYENGLIKKRRFKSGGKYDLILGDGDDKWVIKDVVKTFDNGDHSVMTRMISLSLRHGIQINFLSEQLGRDKDADLFSFNKTIARVLKKYIEDGTKVNKKCDSCSGENMTYQEGCLLCLDCGYSKCG